MTAKPTSPPRRAGGLPVLPSPGILLLGVILLAGAGPARADEYARVEPLWVEPLAGRPALPRQPALLNLPMSWQVGDAAVVLVSGPGRDRSLRNRLVGSLLDSGAAVLEIELRRGRRGAATEDVVAAGAALRHEVGAGLIVAVGLGLEGAPGVLLASAHPGFVAHVGLVGAEMAFVPGTGPVPPQERWAERAGPFCAALAWAIQAVPTPVALGGAGGEGASRDCAAALAPQAGPTLAVSVR
jgi:hypothetical protein